MGGIGKTTLARALHNKLASKFSSSCCVLHAHKEIERVGIDSLQAKIFSELLDNEAIPSNGLDYAIERIKRARVLLILDDLKDSNQLKELVGGHDNFGQGSRIVITSRDKQALQKAEEDKIYQVTKMSDEDSLQLFNLNAFKQNPSVKTYKTLVERVLEYAQGVPLVLNVLGRLLCGKSIKVWESMLKKLQKFPHHEVFNVLKLSYDGLDDEEKDIFLEIVCFYVGELEDIALDLLDGCGFSAHIGMDVLKDRGLISISHHQIVMHDLILEMGLQIVSQQHVNNNPRKHVGLCKYEEIYNKQGTDAINFLGVCKIEEDELDPETFKNMHSLRILYFYKYMLEVPYWLEIRPIKCL
ncbi:disease resistance protein RPV1-like isoform X2 [Lotus japonicus]|uniref:disease resistance protein RPV1-like isoform X2 n=1 Tax=Lotus japonicus TaxID=34305 RepID=UPI00258B07F9|nr:disease resistance protein RPV1-like isoform X2 [Lotus japonicus]